MRHIVILLALCACACRPPVISPLPQYAPMSASDSITILAQRAASVHTLQADGDLTLTRKDGQSIRLEAAMIANPPDQLRLRAWKLGQAAFDLTLDHGRAWVYAQGDDAAKPEGASAALAKAWATLSGSFFSQADLKVQEHPDELVLSAGEIVCHVDRATLTPVRYEVKDADGVTRFTLSLQKYELVKGIAQPTVMDAVSEGNRIHLELHEVDVNVDLAPGAFTPPKRAQEMR